MFAPAHHSAMKYAIGPRKEMAVRTIFNVLGPLTNPAGTKRNYIGVYDKSLVEPIAHVLMKLGNKHALVVHGLDGLDEISIEMPTLAAELKDNQVITYEIRPEDYGIERQALSSIVVQDSAQSLAMIKSVFSGEYGPARDAIALNAGAGIYVAGIAGCLSSGIELASSTIASGAAMTKFNEYIAFSQNLD
jgi:anthranilate phosphoribosyltransferase